MKKLFTSLTCLLVCVYLYGQEITIKGKITDPQTNEGISGITVSEEGQANIAVTDAEGNFELVLSSAYTTLKLQHPDFKTQKVYVNGETSLSLNMVAKATDLLNVGIGKQSKEETTSSVASIKTDEGAPQPVINLEQANQGKASGLFIQNNSGKLGEGSSVRIRGGSSLSASNQPLYVVDGVPLTSGSHTNIDPSIIESMEVLKDASATSIYGSRAANGVILITTKKGNKGRLQIDADYQFGVSQTPKYLDLYSPEAYNRQTLEYTLRFLGLDDYITYAKLAEWSESSADSIQLAPGFKLRLPGVLDSLNYNTDWQKEVFRTATSHRANLNLSGGSEKHQYFIGGNFTSQEGILIGNNYERLNGRFNLNSQLTDKLSTTVGVNYVKTTDYRLNEDQDLGSPLQAIVLPPSDTYDPNNDYKLAVRSLEYNPLTEINYSDNIAKGNSIIGNLGVTYNLSEELTINADGGLDIYDYRSERRQGPQTLEGAPSGYSRLSKSQVFNYVFNGFLEHEKNIGSRHSFSSILGTSYQKSITESSFRRAEVNSISELESLNETNPTLLDLPIPGTGFAMLSYYSRINYTLDNKYTLQFSGRVDGSSKFSEENRYGFFPALSAGWTLSNESFLQSVPAVSFLKLKASYGIVGNTPEDDFLYRPNYYRVRYGNEEAIRAANLPNPDLTWESTTQIDVGVDFGLLSDRINGSINYYQKTTTDLLFPVPISQTSGFGFALRNLGSLENKGLEFNLTSVNVETKNFTWSTDFNISTNENTVTDLGGRNLILGVNAYLEGEAAGAFYMRKYAGVNPQTGEALYENKDGSTTTDWEEADRMVVGNPNPKFFGGLGNSLSYSGFDLNFFFQFVQGNDIYYATGEYLSNSGILNLGQSADQEERWYEPGDEAKYPVLNPTQDNTYPSSRWLQDGSYVRLKSVTLTYNLPADVLSSWGVRSVSFYVGGQNLWTLTDYIGYDPDVNYVDPESGTIGQNINRGIDNFTAPQARTFITGIKIGI